MNNLEIYGTPDYKALTGPERTVFKNAVEALSEKGLFRLEDIAVIAGYARNVVLPRETKKGVKPPAGGRGAKSLGGHCFKTTPPVALSRYVFFRKKKATFSLHLNCL